MNEQAKEDTYEPPPTDPAQALRDAAAMVREFVAEGKRRDEERAALIRNVQATLILTEKELRELKTEYEAAQTEREKRDGIWKRVIMMFVSLMGWNEK